MNKRAFEVKGIRVIADHVINEDEDYVRADISFNGNRAHEFIKLEYGESPIDDDFYKYKLKPIFTRLKESVGYDGSELDELDVVVGAKYIAFYTPDYE